MKEKKLKKSPKQSKINWKDLFASERGKSLLFFGFYAIFFFVVIILVRTSHSTSSHVSNKEKQYKIEVSYEYKLDQLENKNYHYKYLTTIDSSVVLYEGNRTNSKELFSVTTSGTTMNYFRDGDLFIKQEGMNWLVADTPYAMGEFYDIENISRILSEAQFISKTEYKDGSRELKFSITTSKLVKLLTNQMTNTEEDYNEIIIKIDSDKNVYGVEYDLTNYCTYSYQRKEPMKAILELSYSEFGKIKEIEKP